MKRRHSNHTTYIIQSFPTYYTLVHLKQKNYTYLVTIYHLGFMNYGAKFVNYLKLFYYNKDNNDDQPANIFSQ